MCLYHLHITCMYYESTLRSNGTMSLISDHIKKSRVPSLITFMSHNVTHDSVRNWHFINEPLDVSLEKFYLGIQSLWKTDSAV